MKWTPLKLKLGCCDLTNRVSPVLTQHVLRLAELVVQHRLPAIYFVLRMDGGFGTTEGLNWVLSRGYQGVAKISHSGRVRTLRQHLEAWQPTSSLGREMAPVLRPHRFCRATRQWVMRTPKDKGGYQYAVLLTTVPRPGAHGAGGCL